MSKINNKNYAKGMFIIGIIGLIITGGTLLFDNGILWKIFPPKQDEIKTDLTENTELSPQESRETNSNLEQESNVTNTTDNSSDLQNNEIKLLVNYYPQEDLYATLRKSYIYIKASKYLNVIEGVASKFPFSWGINLDKTNSTEEIGSKYIELQISINENYEVVDTGMSVYEVTKDGHHLVDHWYKKINAVYDGEYFIIEGDISNPYVDLESICVRSVFYCD